MKNTMIFGLAVSMIATSMAVAAPMKAAKAPVKKAAAVAKAKAAPAKPVVAVAPAPVVAAPAPVVAAPSAGQSASTVAAATQEVKKSKFGMLIIDRADFTTMSANRSETTQADATLTLRPSYKVNDSTSVAAGIDIGHSFGANEDTDAKTSKAVWTPFDAYLMVSKSSLGTLPGDIKVKGNARWYLPTSEDSQDAGTIGVLRANLTLAKSFGKLTARYSADPRAYFQQYNTYQKAGETKQTATNQYRLTHYAELDLQITEKLNIYTDLGIDHRYKNGDDNFKIAAKQKDDMLAETGIGYAFNDNITAIIGVEQLGPDLRDPSANNESNAVYRDDKSSYFLEADVTF